MGATSFPASENATLVDGNGFPLADPRSGGVKVNDPTLEDILIVLHEIKLIMQSAFHIELK